MGNKEFDQFMVREELSIEEIENLVTSYADFDLEEGSMSLREEFYEAETRIQLLVPLLVLRAFEQDGKADSAAIGPVDLAELTDNSVGEAYPVIRELEQAGILENVGKEYRVVPDKPDQIHTEFNSDTQAEVAH